MTGPITPRQQLSAELGMSDRAIRQWLRDQGWQSVPYARWELTPEQAEHPVLALPRCGQSGQPLPSVLPALDFADLDDPSDASVLPAFESAPLLGFPPLFAILNHLLPACPRSTGGHRHRVEAIDMPEIVEGLNAAEWGTLGTSGTRLLVPLTQDRCLARLGPGARVVALIAAAHARRVALIWPA